VPRNVGSRPGQRDAGRGIASERRWIRYARSHLAGLFPRLPGQSGYGKRLRSSGGLPVIKVIRHHRWHAMAVVAELVDGEIAVVANDAAAACSAS
jgi:hypothetical protein